MAVSLEDVWSGPREEGFDSDIYIKWRVEGTEGVAQGTIGWPDYPDGSPSTLRYASQARHRRQMGRADLGHDLVPRRLRRRDGAAAVRAEVAASRRC